MNKRFKITLFREPGGAPRLGPLPRFKLALFGILVAVIAFGALGVALLVGSVVAAILGTVLILATLVTFLAASLQKR